MLSASILIVRDICTINQVQCSRDAPNPPQNRTLWTIVMPLPNKTLDFAISCSLRILLDGSQTAKSDYVSAMAVRAEL